MRGLRRLYFEQALGWSVAWLIGLGSLFAVVVLTHGRMSGQDLDAKLSWAGIGVYGLTWMDDEGFHGELLAAEPAFQESGFDIWIVPPAESAAAYLAPKQPKFQIEGLRKLATEIVESEADSYFAEGRDANGTPFRLHGMAYYDHHDQPHAAIFIIADPSPWQADHERFIRETGLALLVLVVLGLAVGLALSRRAMQPVLSSLEQQKRFLAAAAHELRTPIASLRAVCESAEQGDEAPVAALDRISRLTQRTAGLVEELLLLARLDAGAESTSRQELRLDLIAEAALPEDGSVVFDGQESIVEADPILLEVALRNLIENARVHAGEGAQIRVGVRGSEVAVEDDGPGFEPTLLSQAFEPFISRPGSPGSGLGLAIVSLIAERHGGRLILENCQPRGARVTLRLGAGPSGSS